VAQIVGAGPVGEAAEVGAHPRELLADRLLRRRWLVDGGASVFQEGQADASASGVGVDVDGVLAPA
jgi:hypothetical protein